MWGDEEDDARWREEVESTFFTQTIQVIRTKGTETDPDGDKRTAGERVVAEMPGRIVRGSDPLQRVEAERVVEVKTWEVRLSLSAIEQLRRERGCFQIEPSDRFRDKKTGATYQVTGNDKGRAEESYLSVFCVQVK